MARVAEEEKTPAPVEEIGLGSHVRIEIPGGRDGFMAGLRAREVNGVTGVVVRAEGPPSERFTIRLDDQSGAHGWTGYGDQGDPNDRSARCYSMAEEGLVLLSGGVKPEPETEPTVREFKEQIYAKAMDLCRNSYAGWEDRVHEWLTELNMAPRTATYVISGELKFGADEARHRVRDLRSVMRSRLQELPDVKVEVKNLTFPRRRAGETVESLTASIFALVDRVCRNEGVCGEARVFVRRLGLRPPPRKPVKVELDLNLNDAERNLLARDGSDALLALVRERFNTVRVLETEPEPEPEPEAKPTTARKVRAKSAIDELELLDAG